MKIFEEFQIHETLNPKIWDNNTLRPEVRDKIMEIVDLFESQLTIPLNICDIQLCGSNASFNYTEHSDLDLHIIANYETVDCNEEILQSLYNAEKSRFNRDYDISLHGVEVELYVQDVRSTVASNGIFSVLNDNWVKEPKPIKSATKHNTDKEVQRWIQEINSSISENDFDRVNSLLNNVYLMRHNAIAVDGEYSKGNQIFKDLRNLGYLDKLKSSLKSITSKKLSLENLSMGHLVNRLNDD